MQQSYLLPLNHKRVILSQDVRQHLRLSATCTLHGQHTQDHIRGADGHEFTDNSIVLSPIPAEYWPECYRIYFITSDRRNSLARACGALAEQGLEILLLHASACTLQGALAVHAVVWSASDRLPDGSDIRRDLYDALSEASVLLQSDLLGNPPDSTSLAPVHVVPLSFLRCFSAARTKDTQPFYAPIASSSLNLDLDPKCSAYDQLLSHCAFSQSAVSSAAVTVNVEECYLRLWLVPEREIHRISFEFKQLTLPAANASSLSPEAESKPSHPKSVFAGTLNSLLTRFGDAPLCLNLFHLEQHLMEKTQSDGEQSETVRLALVGDTARCEAGRTTESIRSTIGSQLTEWAKTTSTLDIKGIMDSLAVAPLPASIVPVFLSTNAKPSKSIAGSHLLTVKRLVANLRDAGLFPVNVSTSLGQPLLDEVLSLLRRCPLVVSVHLPDETLAISGSGEIPKQYAPSSWVLFEEAYALSRPEQMRLLRLRHESVAPPAYARGMVEDTFSDQSYDTAIASIMSRIADIRASSEWREMVRRMRRDGDLISDIFRYDIDRILGEAAEDSQSHRDTSALPTRV